MGIDSMPRAMGGASMLTNIDGFLADRPRDANILDGPDDRIRGGVAGKRKARAAHAVVHGKSVVLLEIPGLGAWHFEPLAAERKDNIVKFFPSDGGPPFVVWLVGRNQAEPPKTEPASN